MATPYSVIRHEVARSTQDVAREQFSGGPVLVVADRQEQGRGRGGSSWVNADRAVAFSLAFEPRWARDDWGVIPLIAGVVTARITGAMLKWPNDIVADDRKLGGILVESSSGGPIVVGIGLNLWWRHPPAGMGGIHDFDPGPTAADDTANAFATGMLVFMEAPAADWPIGEYVERCVTIGREIAWLPNGAGRAVGVAHDGGLIVETTGGTETIRSGEVRHVRS